MAIYIEAVHRLSDLGAVVTHVGHGTSQEGFEAEWRMVHLLTVEGDLFNRSEMFDEADLDAALARFDELSRPAPQLENAASRCTSACWAYFAARDWDAMAEMRPTTSRATIAVGRERRRPTRSGRRDREHAERSPSSGSRDRRRRPSSRPVGSASSSFVSAISGAMKGPRRFTPRCSASSRSTPTTGSWRCVSFDADDIDAAFAELDARYLAGEAAPTRTRGRSSRGTMPRSTGRAAGDDAGLGEHRPPASGTPFAPGELTAYHRTPRGTSRRTSDSTSRPCIG